MTKIYYWSQVDLLFVHNTQIVAHYYADNKSGIQYL